MILQHKDGVNATDRQHAFGFHPQQRHIKDEIVDFLYEKSCYLDELLALRRIAMNDKYASEKAFRMRMALSVPQLALFFRVQMESGILSKQELFNLVAQHIFTEKAHHQ